MSRNGNLDKLRRIAAPFRARTAVRAVRAGQAVIESGLKRRCPVGATHGLVDSIKSTRVSVGPHSAGGFVVVTSRHAVAVEYGTIYMHARPFVRPTRANDGPAALRAMSAVLGAKP